MYEVEISISNLSSTSSEFDQAANAFVQQLQAAPGLETKVELQRIPGSRGAALLLSGIITTGVQLGAFAAIHELAKDLFAVHRNSEVELKFKDGSTLKIKNLTRSEAEAAINAHLLADTRRKKKR